jgi:hypothetical protein
MSNSDFLDWFASKIDQVEKMPVALANLDLNTEEKPKYISADEAKRLKRLIQRKLPKHPVPTLKDVMQLTGAAKGSCQRWLWEWKKRNGVRFGKGVSKESERKQKQLFKMFQKNPKLKAKDASLKLEMNFNTCTRWLVLIRKTQKLK